MAAYYKQKTKEELEKLIEESKTFAELMRKLGYSANRGASFLGLKKYLDNLGVDYSKYSKTNILNFSHPKKELDDVMVENSDYTNLRSLKKRILREKLLEEKCAICGISEWQGKKIVLQLDHINGDNRDNRLENLRLLCPNCHSQTETFCRKRKGLKEKTYCKECGKEISGDGEYEVCSACFGKRLRKIERPGKEELYQMLIEDNFTSVGKKYGVTDNSVKKWCRSYGIPDKASFYKGIKKEKN